MEDNVFSPVYPNDGVKTPALRERDDDEGIERLSAERLSQIRDKPNYYHKEKISPTRNPYVSVVSKTFVSKIPHLSCSNDRISSKYASNPQSVS